MSSESDFEDSESDLSDGEQVQTVQQQPAPPHVRDVKQTSGQISGQFLNNDPLYNAMRADSAERLNETLEKQIKNLTSQLYELQNMCETLQEENKTLKAQLGTQATGDSLRW